MKRLSAIAEPKISDNAGAAVIGLHFADGNREDVEIERDKIEDLLRAILATCKALGDRVPNERPLPQTAPVDAIAIPAGELATVTDPAGGVWLILRVGSLDVSVFFPVKGAANALAHALLHPRTPPGVH